MTRRTFKQKEKQPKQFKQDHPTPSLQALNYNQQRYIDAITHDDVTVGIGPPGSGKSFLVAHLAAQSYLNKQYRKIYLTRPNVECGQTLGALPGTLDEKFEPWVMELTKVIKKVIGENKFKCDYGKNIHAIPLQYMRGMSLDDSIVIVDEAQNTTIEQMKMILTRIGYNSKIIVNGDLNQTDLKGQKSGLQWFVEELRRQNVPGIEIIEFTIDDCVRSDTCKKMIKLIQNAG